MKDIVVKKGLGREAIREWGKSEKWTRKEETDEGYRKNVREWERS